MSVGVEQPVQRVEPARQRLVLSWTGRTGEPAPAMIVAVDRLLGDELLQERDGLLRRRAPVPPPAAPCRRTSGASLPPCSGRAAKLMPPLLRRAGIEAERVGLQHHDAASVACQFERGRQAGETTADHRDIALARQGLIITTKWRVLVPPKRLALEIMIRSRPLRCITASLPSLRRAQSCFAAITSTSRRSVGCASWEMPNSVIAGRALPRYGARALA